MKFNIIDKSLELEEIKRQYGAQYYLSKEAHQKAAELWGVACNNYGVCENIDTETIYERGKYRAEVRFSNTQNKTWLIGLSASTSTLSYTYCPSVWRRQGFVSYHDARLYGVFELQAIFSKASENATFSQLSELKRLIAHLEAEKTPQMDLFNQGVLKR